MHAAGPAALPLDPVILGGVVVCGALYAYGLRRLWRRAGTGSVVSRKRGASFAAGLVATALALSRPVEEIAADLFSAHMIQHLLLLNLAAPLLVLGQPHVVLPWALSRGGRRRAAILMNASRVARSLRPLLDPVVLLLAATATLWLWHLPPLYDRAVRDDGVHALEHAMFLGTAALFWHATLGLGARAMLQNGRRLLMLALFAMQGAVLGALITFASRPLYESYAAGSGTLTALEDQQLAGILMWVPPTIVYLLAGGRLFLDWLRAIGERSDARDAIAARAREVRKSDGTSFQAPPAPTAPARLERY